jgi:hypothetical protein
VTGLHNYLFKKIAKQKTKQKTQKQNPFATACGSSATATTVSTRLCRLGLLSCTHAYVFVPPFSTSVVHSCAVQGLFYLGATPASYQKGKGLVY